MTHAISNTARMLTLAALTVAAAIAFAAPASAMPKGMQGMMGSIMENETVKSFTNEFTESELGKSVQQQFQGRKGKRGQGGQGGQGGLGGLTGGQGGSGLDQLRGLGSSLGLD